MRRLKALLLVALLAGALSLPASAGNIEMPPVVQPTPPPSAAETSRAASEDDASETPYSLTLAILTALLSIY